MSCERYRNALTDAAAGAPVPADLEAHVASCEGCRRELASLRRALAIADAEMSALAAAQPSPELVARIRGAVAAPESGPAWGFGWLWPATAVAAALLVALAVWVGRPSAPARVTEAERGRALPGESPLPAEPGRPPAATESSAPAGSAAWPANRSRARSDGPPRGDEPVAAAHLPALAAGRPVPGAVEVLVPRGEAEALVRFAAIVHRDRHAPGAFVTAGRPSPDLAEPAALDITPLEIVPLDPAETPGT